MERDCVEVADDQRHETRGIRLTAADITPTQFDRVCAQTQDIIAQKIQQAQTVKDLLKHRYIQVSLTWHNLQSLRTFGEDYYNSPDAIINYFGRLFDTEKEVQKLAQMYRGLERARNGDEFYLHIELDTVLDRHFVKSRALLRVPEHRLRRNNPPYSGELYYFIADSVCLTGDIMELVNKGMKHIKMMNIPWQRIERELWPNSKSNPATMLESNMDENALRRFMKELTLESYQIESAKKGLYILAGILGRLPVSDPQSFNITRLKSQLK